jgi:hypothetical protein
MAPGTRRVLEFRNMRAVKAHVSDGRLRVDEPTTFPEGSEVDLLVADPEDDLDDEERARLNEALSRSWKSALAGRTRPAEELLARLRARR